MLLLGSVATDWISAVGGGLAALLSIGALRVAVVANRKSHEANELARRSSQVQIEVRPFVERVQGNPTGAIGVAVLNVGVLDARINSARLEFADASEPMRRSVVNGDIAAIPGTLLPGHRCKIIFSSRLNAGSSDADGRALMTKAKRIIVEANNREFATTDESAFEDYRRGIATLG